MAVAVVAACSSLPRPFAHTNSPERAPNGLVTLIDAGGIRVEIDKDLPEKLSEPLGKEMVRGLNLADVPASTLPDFKANYTLAGTLHVNRPDLSGPEEVVFSWTLADRDGVQVGSFYQPIQGDKFGWFTEDQTIFRVVAEDAGRQIAAMVQTPEQIAARETPGKPPPARTAPRFYLLDIDGAPGDGAVSLRRSLAFVMEREGAEIVKNRDDAQYMVKGFVNVSGVIDNENDVALTWLVTSHDGKELGKVSQNNKVPAGRLDNRWGDMALAVANGATLGIKGVIVRHLAAKNKQPGLEIPFQ